MDYIFVSYSRRQLYFAESVALYLQRAGLEVWFDLQKLTPGVEWAATLKDGYSNCNRLVLVASRAALQSSYVQVEWETALQNGREVILVLTEAVVLPEALRGCPVYDARVHFDRTMQSLTGYLRGEQAARRDPVPLPAKSPYSLNMPFDIWLTLAAHLTGQENADVNYALQISPTGFDNANGFPRRVGYVLGSFYLLLFLLALVMTMLPLEIDDWLGFVLIAIPGIPLLLYVDALAMRKVALPLRVHKWLGNHVAWFASPAPAAPDAIGNTDSKYVYKLTSWTRRS